MSLKIVKLHPEGDPATGLQPCQFVDPINVDGDPPKETGHTFFTNTAGNLTSGVWKATPYKEAIDSYPVDELIIVLEGSVTVTDSEGAGETFSAGDTFIIPKGFEGTWENTETMRKLYMILE